MSDDPRVDPIDAFDPFDQELRRRFDAASRGVEDPDAVLDGLRPRLRRAGRGGGSR